ncbi:hypothetical protein G8A07_25530 [Roseateles sp. DAIF2]|uniref:hypothetical protein n=1 Tax=Roseateles sp. DAIF2 TaxID=2714952 RepID=UPI0018A329D5|nr:hypothetical protein [Roseateles sp. DAIF2]QPF75948.1 hypothetical protein G8A07_25530 [Roseateles sp. DAIF2]
MMEEATKQRGRSLDAVIRYASLLLGIVTAALALYVAMASRDASLSLAATQADIQKLSQAGAPPAPASFCGACLATDGSTSFTDADRKALHASIEPERNRSARNALVNQTYDIGFKLLLFAVSCAAAVGAARVAALEEGKTPSARLKTSNLVLTALVPLISTLAFTQFDFFKRHTIWEKRQYALLACQMALQHAQPERTALLSNLDAILGWGDASAVGELTASCTQKLPLKPQEPSAEARSVDKAADAATARRSAGPTTPPGAPATTGRHARRGTPPGSQASNPKG